MGAVGPISPATAQAEELLINEAKLLSLAEATTVPTPSSSLISPLLNPLLSRTKLKKKSKPKPNKAKAPVVQVKAEELNADAGGEDEGEGLDLMDQLLAQMESQAAQVASEEAPQKTAASSLTPEGDGDKKVSRQLARKLKKATHIDFLRSAAQAEVEAENDQSVEEERKGIDEGCAKLGVQVKDIAPDGHCLYSAIADQANFLGLSMTATTETYVTTRLFAASYMRAHPDDFLPFLTGNNDEGDVLSPEQYPKYCDMVEKTAEWGGQAEIRALSKYFNAPIHVLQAGADLLKVGEDVKSGRGPMLISYHRKMYGLGEHYNSLRPL